MIPAYPLSWPTGWKRTPSYNRTEGRFGHRAKGISVAEGVGRVREELQRMGISENDLVVSTNVALRMDGWPRSDQANPADAGVAVYWRERSGETRSMAIDRYRKVADNLAAIAATLEAMRAIERHGGAEILNRAFVGFAALPGPSSTTEWWVVLNLHPNAKGAEVEEAYRRMRSLHHPDKGGEPGKFQQVENAYKQAVDEGRT